MGAASLVPSEMVMSAGVACGARPSAVDRRSVLTGAQPVGDEASFVWIGEPCSWVVSVPSAFRNVFEVGVHLSYSGVGSDDVDESALAFGVVEPTGPARIEASTTTNRIDEQRLRAIADIPPFQLPGGDATAAICGAPDLEEIIRHDWIGDNRF